MTMKKVLGCIRKADQEFDMIQDNDKICVGVSGGKDSVLDVYKRQEFINIFDSRMFSKTNS